MYSKNMVAQVFTFVPVFLIFFIIVAAFLAEFDVRKNIRKLAKGTCSKCGTSFGQEVLREARVNCKKPEKKNIFMKWDFLCPSCKKSFFVKAGDWVLYENN